jgi:hypothetical protein
MGILYIYRHGNLAHPPAGAIVDGLGPRIGPGLMIAAGGGLGGAVWLVNTLTTGWCFSTYGPPLYKSSSASIEMLRSTIFWLLYASSASASGVMATAQLGPIAED